MTEEVTLTDGKVLTLHFNEKTGLVSKIEVYLPNRMKTHICNFPYNTTREVAIQQVILTSVGW